MKNVSEHMLLVNVSLKSCLWKMKILCRFQLRVLQTLLEITASVRFLSSSLLLVFQKSLEFLEKDLGLLGIFFIVTFRLLYLIVVSLFIPLLVMHGLNLCLTCSCEASWCSGYHYRKTSFSKT